MVSPAAVYEVVVGNAMFVKPDVAFVERCTAYRSIAAPPLLDGTTHDSLTLAFHGVAVGERGADGGVAAASGAALGTATWADPLSVATDVAALVVVVGATAA